LWGDPAKPDAAALILQRSIPIVGFAARLRVMYIPKGPLLRDWGDAALRNQVLDDLRELARKQGAIFLKIDPDIPLGTGIPATPDERENPLGAAVCDDLRSRGWHFSDEQIQFRNTVLVDLAPSEDDILVRMKQKTRYNIRLAGRKGVTVRPGTSDDFGLLYRMYAETSVRDGFVIRDEDYYRQLWGTFINSDLPTRKPANLPACKLENLPTCEPLIAEVDGEPVAAVVIFRFAERAYYMHGMSRPAHRNKMSNYLLQWEAMRRARAAGCTVYDLWGAPEIFAESDSMWSVFRFKRGLGGKVLRTIGAYDLPIRPLYYRLYTQVLPRILDVMRRRGQERTERTMGS
ncbi:MAG: peptidoglycan bridge formation glycyltransferase FemA/FemB family protein, partial [Chloroflexi bacterium]|nr:peptidoglycan bridge formation glycyltransferase FemA/FemB family protein [Chloroflexota bacterium]